MKTISKFVFILFFSCCSIAAFAGRMQIIPVRADLAAPRYNAFFTLKNLDDKPLFVKTYAKKWLQQDGKDFYIDSRDLLVTPIMTSIKSADSQILRVALLAPPNLLIEQAFYLYVLEIPQRAKPVKGSENKASILTAWQLAIPIFVGPVHPIKHLNWRLTKASKGKLKLWVTNDSNVHVQFRKFTFNSSTNSKLQFVQDKSFCLLAHQHGSFDLTIDKTSLSNFKVGDTVNVTTNTDQGDFQSSVKIVAN
jgi:P pilus assembly chaperone PapD